MAAGDGDAGAARCNHRRSACKSWMAHLTSILGKARKSMIEIGDQFPIKSQIYCGIERFGSQLQYFRLSEILTEKVSLFGGERQDNMCS
jgi:hypothetical protein